MPILNISLLNLEWINKRMNHGILGKTRTAPLEKI